MRYVIRDNRFGLAIYEAETPEGALIAFIADKLAADGRRNPRRRRGHPPSPQRGR